MFAFLALAGDLGATASPAMVGSLAEMAGSNLKTGLLSATIFPVVLIISLLMLKLSISKTPKLKQQRTEIFRYSYTKFTEIKGIPI